MNYSDVLYDTTRAWRIFHFEEVSGVSILRAEFNRREAEA